MVRTEREIIDDAVKVKDKPQRRLLYIMAVVVVLFLGLTLWLGIVAYTATSDRARLGADVAAQVKAACEGPEVNSDLLESWGISCPDAEAVIDAAPTPVPSPSPGPQGEPGESGEEGPPPSDAQVAQAVASYCADRGGCRGRSVTPAQVASAVASYCNNRGQCRGPSGEDGEDGAPGPQGPPPSDAQVATAVGNYCAARNECRGPQGERGEPGPTGPPGVVAINCDAPDGQVIDEVLYDASNQTVNCTYKDDQAVLNP